MSVDWFRSTLRHASSPALLQPVFGLHSDVEEMRDMLRGLHAEGLVAWDEQKGWVWGENTVTFFIRRHGGENHLSKV